MRQPIVFVSYSINLPVDWIQSVLDQKCIAFRKVAASEEASICRKRGWMRSFQDQMFRVRKHCLFGSCRASPQHEDHRPILLIQDPDRSIRKFFPADPAMGIRLMRTYCKYRIQ